MEPMTLDSPEMLTKRAAQSFASDGSIPKLDYNSSSASNAAADVNIGKVADLVQNSSDASKGARGNSRKKIAFDPNENYPNEVLRDVGSKKVVDQENPSQGAAGEAVSSMNPLFQRPMLVEGPYAPIKFKRSQKAGDYLPEDPEAVRRAEYELLRRRLEVAYRHMAAEVQQRGDAVTHLAHTRMHQAYDSLQRRYEVDKLEITSESAAVRQCIPFWSLRSV